MTLEAKLAASLGASALRGALALAAAPLIEQRAASPAWNQMHERVLAGVARAIAGNASWGRWLAHRPELLERLAAARPDALDARGAELERFATRAPGADLEGFLDELRLLRRDEMLFAGCLHLSGLADFEDVSRFLSVLAESCMRRALIAAEAASAGSREAAIAVLGMGKLAGREFTYHSDLDVIFLYDDDLPDAHQPSRTAQRFISYVSTMTGAGYAYQVDSRLRPSGQQGSLVTTHEAFARYQIEQAATWEHLALMRSRAVAGDVERAQETLRATRERIVREAGNPWPYVSDMRKRVVEERGVEDEKKAALKAGRGGVMDVEFLAAGSLLERGLQVTGAELPSVPAMLRAACAGQRLEALIDDYTYLRQVEACARWQAGRAIETVPIQGEAAALVAELVQPGASAGELAGRVAATRARIALAFDSVAERGSVEALASGALNPG